MLKLDSNVGVICLGVLSVVFAFSYADNKYLLVLQLLGGVGLIIGVQTKNHLFFLPWLIFYGWFTNLLAFLLTFVVIGPGPDGRIIYMLGLFVVLGALMLAFYSVIQAFNRIYRERAMSGLINNV